MILPTTDRAWPHHALSMAMGGDRYESLSINDDTRQKPGRL